MVLTETENTMSAERLIEWLNSILFYFNKILIVMGVVVIFEVID